MPLASAFAQTSDAKNVQSSAASRIERIRIRVGLPRVVQGPSPGIPDNPFTEIQLRNGRFRGFSASGTTYAIDGATPSDMTGTPVQVIPKGGCDLEIYLRGFSYEQKPAYGNDRSDDELRKAMHGKAELVPPHGAAIAAARAALYAALVRLALRSFRPRLRLLMLRPLPGAFCWPGQITDFGMRRVLFGLPRKTTATLSPTAARSSRNSAPSMVHSPSPVA